MALLPLKDENPLTRIRFQYVTVAIIATNVLVFLWQLSAGPAAEAIAYGLGAIPAVIFGSRELAPELAYVPAPLTLVTSMFLHGGWMHLIGNMLFLWVFGDNIEDAMGHGRFIVFYLVCGLAAALSHAALNPASVVPMVGASGAVSGVLGAYLVLHPRARVVVLLMYFVTRLPAIVVLGAWIGMQLLYAFTVAGGPMEGGTAWWAHIGGFATGAGLIVLLHKKTVPLVGSKPPPGYQAAPPGHRRVRSVFPDSRGGPES